MNVGIFNRVNSKSPSSDGMYSEWSSLPLEGGGRGVLDALGGRDVVVAVVPPLAESDASPLTTDAEVEWVLEVIRFGLSLPLQEHEALRACVRVCCSWLAPLLPPAPAAMPPPPPVPAPVSAAPHRYARKILAHLHNLFVPRPNESGDLISKQAVLCHRVLRLARALADSASLGAAEWRALLLLLLAAAAALLGPPAPHHAAAGQLCERVLCVLFEVWILACHRCFPPPPLWRTLREQCLRWRHRAALTEQWTRASLCLTARLLQHMYPPTFPAVPICEEDANLVPADMSAEAVMQTWYRMLHTLGNPVDLCRPHLISQTPHFLQYSITEEEGGRDPSQHPCLQALPSIFHKAMKGIAAHVDAFLGRVPDRWWEASGAGGVGLGGAGPGGAGGDEGELTPHAHRRLAKSFSVSSARPREKQPDRGTPRTSLIGLTGSRPVSIAPATPPNSMTSQVLELEKLPLTPLRPKVNSIFHLFGEWLFEAALVGSIPPANNQQRSESTPPPPSLSDTQFKLNTMSYQAGRAEALGTICRVLCSKQCREEVLAPYLARAYACLLRGLRDPAIAPAVVYNASDIFRLDLDGVLVLVPDFLSALETVLAGVKAGTAQPSQAAWRALLSLVPIPHHYRDLPAPPELGAVSMRQATLGRVAALCVGAVGAETSHTLLAALYLCALHSAQGGARADRGEWRARSRSQSESGSEPAPERLEKELDANSPHFGSALVVRATYLVCHRLITSWKGDLQISLTALEVLSGLAKLHSTKPEAVERKRAVRWICDYISLQCGRPPPAHSRDLHSSVVAAYHCLRAWLCPALLRDAACLARLLQAAELGLSGARSQGKDGEPDMIKDEKELKPVSMRVRDAAESLLMHIVEETGNGIAGAGWCRLDERWLAALGHGKLRHFVADGTILLSLLEEPLANSQEPQPTLIVIIRCAWGRYAWSVSSRGRARCASRPAPPAPPAVSVCEPPPPPAPHCRRPAPLQPMESAFPSIEAVLRQLNDPEAPTLFKLLEQQAAIEKRVLEAEDNVTQEQCVPPEPVTEFQTARLFLSHFGYLNIGGDKKSGPPRLVALDSSQTEFLSALRTLDALGARAAVTAHVYCVRAGRTAASDVLANGDDYSALPAPYVNMLRGLGKPVLVRQHPGWAGHVRTSYLQAEGPETASVGALYDSREQVLYWSDSSTEIAFVVPSSSTMPEPDEEVRTDVDGSCFSKSSDKSQGSWWDVSNNSSGAPSYERSTSECDKDRTKASIGGKERALSLELDKQNQSGLTGSGRRNKDFTTKILIIWLEDPEDQYNVPIDELLPYCSTGMRWRRSSTRVLYVSARRSGLCAVQCAGQAAQDAVLAPALLPAHLRRAAAALAARAALATDLYQPPHVKRRHLIQEIAQQYKKDLTEPELLESLFKPPM